ncbi:CAMK family protein kinase [Metarhizium acridum CQMa 102]|uniref:CAMK family protein kinase n=1 Tax=Metarhizium acridum (strain CQMa 102) TaxID=655827 RepID=E9EAV1_METAQ|nr:CAMK family protein kinase [Metarhizium acridum CQMa 102]EFY86985.1 CAMK family protein kinase [Metarhizium acridum CQMa 102]
MPPEGSGDQTTSVNQVCIEFRFSKIPRSSNGLVFGCGKESGAVLPDIDGVSNEHFSVTFDSQHRLIVKDLDSLYGTRVTYNDGAGIHKQIQFKIIAVKHNVNSQAYKEKVKKCCLGSVGNASTEALLNLLNFLSLPDTRRQTGAHTPSTEPIYLRRVLGRGGEGPQSVSVLRQILSALTYLHGTSPRIVHRDIKPANILVREHTPHGITVVLGDIFRQEDSSVYFTPNTGEAAAMLGEELNGEPSTSQITLQATPRYLTPAMTWSTSGRHPGPHRSPLPNSSSQIVKGEQDGDKSLPSSARLSPSLYPSARTSLRRPVEGVALQGRSSKRQDRGSTSQLPGYSGAPLPDTEEVDETFPQAAPSQG